MPKKVQSREPGAMFDEIESPSMTEIYADGIGGTSLGFPMSKLSLFITKDVGLESGVEEREVYTRLTIPTTQLLQFCLNTLGAIHANHPFMLEMANRQHQHLLALMSRINPPQ